jgi:predicted dienelactone hydrolase
MRPLESVIVVGLFGYVLHLLSPDRTEYEWVSWCLWLCVPFLAWHLMAEGYRWQMLPVYIVLVAGVVGQMQPELLTDAEFHYVASVLMLCGLGGGIVLSTIFPVFQLPVPSGPYQVGTQIRHFVDDSRREPSSRAGARELMVQIWYPAAPSAGEQAAIYLERATTSIRTAQFARVKTHARAEIPLASAQARYPVLIYEPSWDGMRTENTALSEEFASHGYIVVGLDHPYGSLATVFPGGRVVRTVLSDEHAYDSDTSYQDFVRTIETQIMLRAADLRFVLDRLRALDASDPKGSLSGRLDLERIGVFGFSLGGGVAAQAGWSDPRLKACLDMDGVMAGESFEQGAHAPFFLMAGADPVPPDAMPNATPARRREMGLEWNQFVQMKKLFEEHGGYWLSINAVKHFNFSDYAFSSPLRKLSRSGRIDPRRAAQIVREYGLAFFNRYLKGTAQPLLDRPHSDPEYRFEHAIPEG